MIFDDFVRLYKNDGSILGINLGCVMMIKNMPEGLRFMFINGDTLDLTTAEFAPSIVNDLKERYFGANEVYSKMV